jgi:hypothetical protein
VTSTSHRQPQSSTSTLQLPKYCSSAQADIQLDLPSRNAKIMPSFQHNLMGIGKLCCDNNCKVVFDKMAVTVFAHDGSTLLKVGAN